MATGLTGRPGSPRWRSAAGMRVPECRPRRGPAFQPGSDSPAYPSRSRPGRLAVLLTAHFDGVGDDPSARFPAACDNASGVAAVVEAARILHRTLPAGVGLAMALLDAE